MDKGAVELSGLSLNESRSEAGIRVRNQLESEYIGNYLSTQLKNRGKVTRWNGQSEETATCGVTRTLVPSRI